MVKSRLVGIATRRGRCPYLTNLARRTHGPIQVGDTYRVRWKVEIDNKVDKAGARMPELEARNPVSARIKVRRPTSSGAARASAGRLRNFPSRQASMIPCRGTVVAR